MKCKHDEIAVCTPRVKVPGLMGTGDTMKAKVKLCLGLPAEDHIFDAQGNLAAAKRELEYINSGLGCSLDTLKAGLMNASAASAHAASAGRFNESDHALVVADNIVEAFRQKCLRAKGMPVMGLHC